MALYELGQEAQGLIPVFKGSLRLLCWEQTAVARVEAGRPAGGLLSWSRWETVVRMAKSSYLLDLFEGRAIRTSWQIGCGLYRNRGVKDPLRFWAWATGRAGLPFMGLGKNGGRADLREGHQKTFIVWNATVDVSLWCAEKKCQEKH